MGVVFAVLIVIVAVALIVAFSSIIFKRFFDQLTTAEGDTVTDRLRGRRTPPSDQTVQDQAAGADAPPLAKGPRWLEIAGCAGLAVALVLPWIDAGGPYAPSVIQTGAGRLFGLGILVASLLVYRQVTRGARRPGRIALLTLAVGLTASAGWFLANPPIRTGLPEIGPGIGAWLGLPAGLALLSGALLAVRLKP